MTVETATCPPSVGTDERLALQVEQGVLLCCMRMQVMEMRTGIASDGRVDQLLGALGAGAAAPCLRNLMTALSRGCTRMIELQCICRKRISPDERALLDILSLAQAMRPFEALLLLRGFVTQAGADAALSCAEGIGQALAEAGRYLPEPDEQVRHFALSAGRAHARPLSATLH